MYHVHYPEYQVSFYLWRIGPILENCKVPNIVTRIVGKCFKFCLKVFKKMKKKFFSPSRLTTLGSILVILLLLGRSPQPFFKNWKKYHNFGKKYPDCDHLWVKFFIYNTNFKSFQEKKPEIFPCGVFLSRAVHDRLSKCPNSKKTSLP